MPSRTQHRDVASLLFTLPTPPTNFRSPTPDNIPPAPLCFALLCSASLCSASLRFSRLCSSRLRSALLRFVPLQSASLRSALLLFSRLRVISLRFAPIPPINSPPLPVKSLFDTPRPPSNQSLPEIPPIPVNIPFPHSLSIHLPPNTHRSALLRFSRLRDPSLQSNPSPKFPPSPVKSLSHTPVPPNNTPPQTYTYTCAHKHTQTHTHNR